MAKNYKIIWTKIAKEDLHQIYNFHLKSSTKEAADKVTNKLLKKIKFLYGMPFIGQIEPALIKLDNDYRRLIEGNYKIIYHINNDQIFINRIFDTRQDPKKLEIKE